MSNKVSKDNLFISLTTKIRKQNYRLKLFLSLFVLRLTVKFGKLEICTFNSGNISLV